MTDKRPVRAQENKRRTLSEDDISSRRSTPQGPLVNSLGVRGAGAAAAAMRRTASSHDPDRAQSPDKGDKSAKPGQDRD